LNAEAEGDDVGHRVFALADPGQPANYTSSGDATQPVPIIRTSTDRNPAIPAPKSSARESAPRPGDAGIAGAADMAETPTLESIDIAAPEVPAKRRSRGMAIAIVLLALMVIFGTWYAIQAMKKVQPEPTETTPTTPAAARPE
jgi:hypothetical protein